jgi:N-acetylmuramoyl-L-alanine amidase
MPAVLIEVGFISNHEEERNLLSLDFRFRAAQAIVEAIMDYSERENP